MYREFGPFLRMPSSCGVSAQGQITFALFTQYFVSHHCTAGLKLSIILKAAL